MTNGLSNKSIVAFMVLCHYYLNIKSLPLTTARIATFIPDTSPQLVKSALYPYSPYILWGIDI